MTFHLGFELPKPVTTVLDHESSGLTDAELRIIKQQIRKNAALVTDYVNRLDLLVNKEGYPQRETFIEKIRERLYLLMEENNTFRKVLWKHYQTEDLIERPQ